MTREQVETTLGDRSLVAEFGESYDPEAEKGTAISQDVDVGESVRPDTVVTVEMSLGPEPVEITDFTGRPVQEARAALEGAGLTVDATEEFSDDVAAGVVISQDPAEGEGFAGNTTISLVVSKGPEVVEVDVPNVVGQSLKDGKKAIEQAGLQADVRGGFLDLERFSQQLTIIRQEPADGTLPEGSVVTLDVDFRW